MSLPQTYKALVNSKVRGEPPVVKEVPLEKPGPNQVLIKIEYAPLNPTDIHVIRNALGWFPTESRVGREGAGIVAAVGENLKVPFKVGDKVHVLGLGAVAEYYTTESEQLSLIQESLSFEDAASHFINPATVYHMGVTAQRGGHKAVVHTAGASALGKMLIRHLKNLGIKSINIVRRDDVIEELKKEGADYVLNLKAPDFEKQLKEIAEKESATMALEAVAGDFTNVVFKALPPKSTCYVYGSLSFQDVNKIEISALFAGKILTGLVVFDYVKERAEKGELQQLYKEVHDLLPTVFKTKVIKSFKLEEINQAIEYSDKHASEGKVLIKPN